MEETLKKKWDSVRQGVLLAAPLPLVVFGIMLVVLLRHLPEGGLRVYLLSEGTLARLLCMATLADAVAFFVAVYTNRLRLGRGILGVTIGYAVVVMVLSLVM